MAIGLPFRLLLLNRVLTGQVITRSARRQYRFEKPPGSLSKLEAVYLPHQLSLLEKLNRSDRQHLVRLPVLVIPADGDFDETSNSPLPDNLPWGAALAKALIVHIPGQVMGGYEFGHRVRWGPVSSGRATHPTPAGAFHLNWRSPGRHSTDNPRWFMKWYFNFENLRGLSFHAYSLPGYPASHGCVRLLERDARWLYDWGDSWLLSDNGRKVKKPGTPVWIAGRYAYGQPPPWRSSAWLSAPIELPMPSDFDLQSSAYTGFGGYDRIEGDS